MIRKVVSSARSVLLLLCLVITALQYLAGGAILASLLPDIFSFKGGMMMSAVVFIGITLIGGLWSSGLSNIVSVCLIYVGVLYSCFAAVNNAGGIENIAAQLPPTLDWFDPLAGIPMAVIIGWFIVMSHKRSRHRVRCRLPVVPVMPKLPVKAFF